MENEMKTVVEVINRLREKHYIHDFEVSHHKLICKETGECFDAHEVLIDKTFRFEGDSNPDDMSVLFAVTSNSGTKGILLDAFGTYSNADVSEFIKKIPNQDEAVAEVI
jgi:hypothetical protein